MIKEGDIIKLGREILLIKDIHIKRKNKKNIKFNNNETIKDNNALPLSFHTQTSQSLNLNEDFNNFENNNNNNNLEEENERINNETGNNDNIQKTSNNINENKSKDLISCNESEKNSEIIKKNKKICRICYMEESDKRINPLIKPCKCSGSMKYIHYECLLHWLKTKVLVANNVYCENGFFTTYLLNLIECELCKNHLPNYIKHKNKIYSLIDYDKFENDQKKPKEKNDINSRNDNYIIFDEVTPGKQGNKYRFLVKFDENNTIKIGRGLEMQLILNDISVSRNHCQIKIDEDENIILEDSNSKFGTLVLIQAESIEILKGKTLTVQVGTNYLNLKLGIPKNIFGCCGVEEIDERNSYEKINYNSIKYDKKNEILNESITPENSDNEENKENNNQKDELIDKENENNKNIEINVNEKEKLNDNRNNKNNNLINNISTLKIENNLNKNIPNNIQIIKKKIEAINSKEKNTVGASTTIKIEDNKNNNVKKENIIVSENEKEEENKNNKLSDNNNNNDSENESDSDSEESSEDNYSSD
jgi:hypothetical protein